MIYASESHVNRTRECRFGDSPVYETYCETTGELFRACQREHGRCIGAVYVDRPGAGEPPMRVGWVFLKREAYDDAPRETYLHETWIYVHVGPDEVTRTRRYVDLAAYRKQRRAAEVV
jgi:hypothetical protein